MTTTIAQTQSRESDPVPAPLLKALLTHVSNDNSRYAIDGILVRVYTHGTELVATDGKRLARIWKGDIVGSPIGQAIVPTDAIRGSPMGKKHAYAFDLPNHKLHYWQTGKDFPKPDDKKGSRATITLPEYLEGSFPPYEEIIPPVPKITKGQKTAKDKRNEPHYAPMCPIGGANPVYLADACNLLSAMLDTDHTKVMRIVWPAKWSDKFDCVSEPYRFDGESLNTGWQATVILMPTMTPTAQ